MSVLQLVNGEIKEKVKCEFIRRVKKLLRSQLNRGNIIAGMNAWAVVVIRYAIGMLDWLKENLKSIDIKTKKLMTMNESLHPRGNVDTLYLARKEGERGFISYEECVNVEVQSLDKYLSENKQRMDVEICSWGKGFLRSGRSRKALKEGKTSQWLEKPLHGRFLKDTKRMIAEKTWQRLKRRYLKKENEAMMCLAQDQALQVNLIKTILLTWIYHQCVGCVAK